MNTTLRVSASALLAALVFAGSAPSYAADPKMSFFVTSEGSGKGGDLGGLAGADRRCQTLAESVGAGKRTWHAYLSTTATPTSRAVNARSRIGKGPWYNAKGELIARNIDNLHRDNRINKQTALTEKGEIVNGRGDNPNQHDILTGSDSQGMAFPAGLDTTCGNWTQSTGGSALVGHHDRVGLDELPPAKSWNQSHPSRGCDVDSLRSTGGNGRFYCFAAK